MKSNINLLLGLLLTGTLWGTSSQAQERKLSLQDAVTLSLEKNRDLEVSQLEITKSDQKVREARGYLLPSVTASAQYLHFFKRQVSFLPGNFAGLGDNQIATLRVGGTEAFVGGISLVQPIFHPNIGSGIRTAKLYERITSEATHEKQSVVITSVKKAYLNVLITQEQLNLQRQSIARNQQALKDARSLLAQGRASRVDTLRAFVTVENLRPDLIRLTNGIEIAKTVLKRAIGLDDAETIELTDSLRYDGSLPVLTNEEAINEALEARPEISQLALTSKLNSERVKLEAAEYLPKFSAIGLLQTQAQANNLQVDTYTWPVSSYVGLQVSAPLFSGFRTASKVQQAKVTRLQSEKQLDNAREVVRAEVKIALSNVEESKQRIASQVQTVSTAELSFRITQDRWKQGIASRLDLTDAELSLTQAKSNYLQAVYDYLNATVDLDKATGRIQ